MHNLSTTFNEVLVVPDNIITILGGVLKSMLTSDIAIIDIKEYQIKHF